MDRTDDKLMTARMLLDAGVAMLEATSFVSPKAIPQMQDAPLMIKTLVQEGWLERLVALVPNKKGADFAAASGLQRIGVVISASGAHNQSNVRKTPAESLEELSQIREEHPDLLIKLSLATVFGCPFDGEVPLEKIFFVADAAQALDVSEICLCDTVGVANPPQVKRIISAVRERYPGASLSLHLHNTRGLAAANTVAALEEGIDCFETSVAGLGGCPFAPGASGNMATEDLVYLLGELGIECGVDLNEVIRASEFITQTIGVLPDAKINAVTRNKRTGACMPR
jgi:hydroxymethylglutaryl-CoA lyase